MNTVAFCSAPAQMLVYQIRAEEAFTIVVTADGGFLTGNSWDGKYGNAGADAGKK